MTNGLIEDLGRHFDRHLSSLVHEIEAYPDDASLWLTAPGIINPGGTLALHLIGNLNHWIGANLGQTGYVRDRAAEFGVRDVSRSDLARDVEAVRAMVRQVFSKLSQDQLSEVFPKLPDRYAGASTHWFLTHLTIHLGYHLGQLNYHRRILADTSTP